eukprot:gene8202-9081_t
MINNDFALINEDTIFPTPPLLDTSLDGGDSLPDESLDARKYLLMEEKLFRNRRTESSSEDGSCFSNDVSHNKELIARKGIRNVSTDDSSSQSTSESLKPASGSLFRAVVTDSSSQSSIPSSQKTADTEPIDCGDWDESMRTCFTASDGPFSDSNIRSLDTESSQSQAEMPDTRWDLRRTESTTSSDNSKTDDAKHSEENTDVTSGKFDITELSMSKETEDRKRPSIDENWEGINPPEPKLVKYPSFGPLQTYAKNYLRRTSSEGPDVPKA